MPVELNTLSPKKFPSNYSGIRPTLDSSNGVRVGDYAIDTSTTPNIVWYCESNTIGSQLWTRVVKIDVSTISTTPYTAKTTDLVILANCSSSAITINLPSSSGLSGKLYHIKKIDVSANTITIDANAAELIDGETTQSIDGQYDSMHIVCDGAQWLII
jgi:hypothetical protein